MLGRSEKQISKAKASQTARLGQSGAQGLRKRCRKGKSCGASCIHRSKVCMVDLQWVSAAVGNLRDEIQDRRRTPTPRTTERVTTPRTPERTPPPRVSDRVPGERRSLTQEETSRLRANYDKATASLVKDSKAALRKGDTAAYERAERKLKTSYERIGRRINHPLVIDQAWLDRQAVRMYHEGRDELLRDLRKAALRGNRRSYDAIEDRLIKLNNWAATKFDSPRLAQSTQRGAMWGGVSYLRTSNVTSKLEQVALDIKNKMLTYAGDNDRTNYNKLERRLLRIESTLTSKYGRRREPIEEGSIWKEGRRAYNLRRFNNTVAKLVAPMMKAAAEGDRRAYNKYEARLLKFQNSMKDKLNLGPEALVKKGDTWYSTRYEKSSQKFLDTHKKIRRAMEKAAREKNRAEYNRLENRLFKLQEAVGTRSYRLSSMFVANRGDVWKEYRIQQAKKISDNLIGKMRDAAISNNRRLYNRYERRLEKLERAYPTLSRYERSGEFWSRARYQARRSNYLEAREALFTNMREAALRGDREAYDKAESKLMTLRMKSASKFRDNVVEYYNQGTVWNQLTNNAEIRRMQKALGTNVMIKGTPEYGELITIVKGQKLSISYSSNSLSFTVNNDYSADPTLPRATKFAILKQTKRQFNTLFKDILKEGTELSVTAYTSDGRGQDREDEYVRVGFSRPASLGGSMYGRVENGKLVPSTSQSHAAYHGY